MYDGSMDMQDCISIYVFNYFPFGFEGRIWDLIVSVPDHCLSFYFALRLFCGLTTSTLTVVAPVLRALTVQNICGRSRITKILQGS